MRNQRSSQPYRDCRQIPPGGPEFRRGADSSAGTGISGLSRRRLLGRGVVLGAGAALLTATGLAGTSAPALAFTFQDGWRWCRRCRGLYFSGNGTAGACPAGTGGHGGTSHLYRLEYRLLLSPP